MKFGRKNTISTCLIFFALLFLPGFSATSSAADPQRQEGKDFSNLQTRTTIFPKWFKQSFWDLNDDIADARKAGKTGILIYSSATTCTYCIAFIERSFNNPEIEQRLRKQFDVLGMEVIDDAEITDVDGKAYLVKDFLKKYKAYVTPTLLFFGKDGKLLLKITGYYPPEKFMQVLDYLEGSYYEHESWRAYSARQGKTADADGVIKDAALFDSDPVNLDRRDGKAKKPLLVLFDKPGCDACKELHDKVLSVKSTRDWIGRFDAVQINAADGLHKIVTPDGKPLSAMDWVNALDIAYYPAFVFFDESGKEVFRLDTYIRNVRLEGAMELVLNKGYVDEPQLQRWRHRQSAGEQANQNR